MATHMDCRAGLEDVVMIVYISADVGASKFTKIQLNTFATPENDTRMRHQNGTLGPNREI